MNKRLLFSEGGQPMYLDDLRVLQDNSAGQLKMLVDVLGAGNEVFLLNEMSGSVKSVDENTGISTFAVNRNWIYANGIIYEVPATDVQANAWGDAMYVRIMDTATDIRIFANSQTHPCVQIGEAALVLEQPQSGQYWNVWQLKTMYELMAPLILKHQKQPSYVNIPVEFWNGYTGKVEYKEMSDCYRIRINIKSENSTWSGPSSFSGDEVTPFTYSYNSEAIPFKLRGFSRSFGTGGDSDGRMKLCHIHFHEGIASLIGLDFSSDLNIPANCPIQTIFEIPKFV